MTTVTTNKQPFKDNNNSINRKRATQIGIIAAKPVTNHVIDLQQLENPKAMD